MTEVWGEEKKVKRKFNSKNYFQNVINYEMLVRARVRVCVYVCVIPRRYVFHIFYPSWTY